MPRKLPWLKDVPEKPAPKLAERPGKRPRVLSPDLRDDLDSPGAGTPRRKGKTRATRTPSSSPPPQPPNQEFMRDGLAADDIWIMVEDEFLDTARLFTQHLHHAEYHRLKRLAREKNTSALQSISRPVVARGKMSVESQKKHEAMARAQRQAEVMRQIEGGTKDADELEEEAPWAHDPHLGGLMSGSQDSSSQLATLAGIKSKTRAAAGYVGAGLKPSPAFPKSSTGRGSNSSFAGLAKEIERTAASSDEDDLDNLPSCRRPVKKGSVRNSSGPSTKLANARESSMPPPKPPGPSETNRNTLTRQPAPVQSSASMTRSTSVSASTTANSTPSTSRMSKASQEPTTTANTTNSSKSKRQRLTSKFSFFSDFSELDNITTMNQENSSLKRSSKSPEKITRPKLGKEKGQKDKNSISADEIPTFLF